MIFDSAKKVPVQNHPMNNVAFFKVLTPMIGARCRDPLSANQCQIIVKIKNRSLEVRLSVERFSLLGLFLISFH